MGNQVAFAGYDGKIAISPLIKILSGDHVMKEIPRFGLIYCFDWSPSGKQMAVGGSDKICAIYNEDGNLIHETQRKSVIQALQWNHDGTMLAIGDREVAIMDSNGYHIKCQIGNFPDDASPTNTKYKIEALCWSPDGSFLAIGGSDGICLIVETKGYALVHEVHRTSRILSLAWGQRCIKNEYGRYLAISDEGCSVAVVKAGVEPDESEVDEASSAASSSYFSAATDWVLREDCFQDIEEAPSETLSTIKPQGNITSVAFSRCSKSKGSSYLAYAADDCSLTILTTRDWKAVFVSAAREMWQNAFDL
jgi:YD repeat-containing protein